MRDRLTPAQMKMVIAIAHKQGLPVFRPLIPQRIGRATLTEWTKSSTPDSTWPCISLAIKATAPPEVVDRIRKGGPTQGWDQLNTPSSPDHPEDGGNKICEPHHRESV
jgi:hypothetical protein